MTGFEKERLVEKIQHAEDLLDEVYWAIRDDRELKKHAKRLDTITGKVYELKHLLNGTSPI